MRLIGRGKSSSPSLPVLDLFTITPFVPGAEPDMPAGLLIDPDYIQFQVFDISLDEKVDDPVQVYPATPGQRQDVDLVNDRLSLGHFVARWTVPSNEPVGRHQIVWYYAIDGGAEVEVRIEFEVLTSAPAIMIEVYTLPSDMRAEDVGDCQINERDLWRRLVLATRRIDAITQRTFVPTYKVIALDGPGTPVLHLDETIIAVESIDVDSNPVDMTGVRIYNRHITQGLTQPDDRMNPRIEFSDALRSRRHMSVLGVGSRERARGLFRTGTQAIQVRGVFGFTEASLNNPLGETPYMIRHAAMLIAVRELPKIGDVEARFDEQQRSRITSERTRDLSYNLGAGRPIPNLDMGTGDPEIDGILATFCGPLRIRTV